MPRIVRDVLSCLLLAGVYVVVARLGLRYATATRSVTLVWPSSGVSLAALLFLGPRLWPGVALGAFLVNAWTPGVGVPVAAGIAVGNTLEAVLGASLVRRTGFHSAMDRLRDVLGLVLLGGIASTAASATLGVASLRLGGHLAGGALLSTWRVWWLGDLMGDLVFAPLLLTLAASPRPARLRGRRLAEILLLAAALVAATLSAFGVLPWFRGVEFPQPFAVFPLLTWAALRFGPRGAAAGNFVVSLISLTATVNGAGPFARAGLGEGLLQLQSFMAMAVLTSLFLGAAMAERDRAIALRDDFLSLASHELNTPLTALHLDVVSLRRLLARPEPAWDKIHHRAAHTEIQVERLRTLVTWLLDSTQIADGRLSLAPSSVDLTAIVREVAERFATQLRDAGRDFVVDAPLPVPGHWDRLRLEVVVSNLVSNAIKYGEDKPIVIRVLSTGAEVTLSVRDQGIGIALDQQARIFGRFERAVSRQSYAGLGLGLWITRAIVEAMRGRIEIESEPGAGATFTVTLPITGA